MSRIGDNWQDVYFFKCTLCAIDGSGEKNSVQLVLGIISLKSEVAMMENYFKRRHFQEDIILVAVGYYFIFSLNYCDIVEVLHDSRVTVHHTTVMRWVHYYGPLFRLLWWKQACSHSQS